MRIQTIRKRLVSAYIVFLMITAGFVGLLVFEGVVDEGGVDAATLTVGQAGSGAQFNSIQAAINVASPGDTVRVWAGTYGPSILAITVNKALTLIGNGTSDTTIYGDGNGDVMNITSDWVNVTRFTITNSGTLDFDAGIRIDDSDNCRIENNNCSNNENGIYMWSSSNNTFMNNTCNSNLGYYGRGIYLDSSSSNTLINNTCNSNAHNGIYLQTTSNTTLMNNTCNSNLGYYGRGIYLDSSSSNTLINNTCNSNLGQGIALESSSSNTLMNNKCNSNIRSGIYLRNSSYTMIMNNNCNSTQHNAISLKDSSSNTIMNNNCSNNGGGINLVDSSDSNTLMNNTCSNNAGGIGLGDSSSNTVANNNCSNNGYGITLGGSSSNTIMNNTCNSNNDRGIYLSWSSSNIVANNTCNSNNFRGIFLESSSSNTLMNNICSNNDRGISLILSSNNNIVANNTCNSNLSRGIDLFLSHSNTLENNTCSNITKGIYLLLSYSNTLENNTCSNNSQGILLDSSWSNTLKNNTVLLCGVLILGDQLQYWNTHIIDRNNTANGKPVYYWKNKIGGTIPLDAGQVILANCTNVRVENLNISDLHVGIHLGFSYNNTIFNNTCSNNSLDGIKLEFSSSNTIENNTCNSNNLNGMNLYSSSNNTLKTNTCNFNSEYGIKLYQSSNNNSLKSNTCLNNTNGIDLCDSSSNTLENNTCSNNDKGILLHFCTSSSTNDNILKNNTCNSNYWDGIHLSGSSSNMLENNTCSNNGWGIYLSFTSTNTLKNNTCLSNNCGIVLYESNSTTIYNNTCNSNNDYGIYLAESSSNTIFNNVCNSNTGIGIYLYLQCMGNMIKNNTCSNNEDGIMVYWYSTNNTVENNTCNYNSNRGIYLDQDSSINTFIDNTCSNNKDGINVRDSDNNILLTNILINNSIGINLTTSSDYCQIINTSIVNSTTFDIQLNEDSHAYAINCSLNRSKINYVDIASNLTVQWYLHVNVTNGTGSGVANADIIVRDNHTNQSEYRLTNANGECKWIICTQYVEDVTGPIEIHTPHNITASKTPYEGFAKPVMNTSKTVSIVLHQDVTPPDPPTNLIFEMVQNNFINMSWSASSSFDVNGYNVYINDTGTSSTFHLLNSTNACYFNATDLNEETTYYFVIRAYDDVPLESNNLTGYNTTLDTTPPEPPTTLICDKTGGTFVNISWVASTNLDVNGYQIYINDTGSSVDFHYLTDTTDCYFNHTGLPEETTYYFKVIAFDEVPLYSGFSNTAGTTTLDITNPAPATSVSCATIGGTFINLSWTASISTDVVGYDIYVNDTGSTVNFHYLANTTNCYFNHTGLYEEITYYYKIKAFDEVPLTSVFSNTISTTTLDVTAPVAPTGVVAKDPTGSTITIDWNSNPESDVQGYKVYINGSGTGQTGPYFMIADIGGTPTPPTQHTVVGLHQEIRYYFFVTAYDEVPNESPWSVIVDEKTLDVTEPVQPINLQATAIAGRKISLNWDSNPELDIDGYFVYMNDTNNGPTGTFHIIYETPDTGTSYTVQGLFEKTTYYFKIIAFDEVPNNSSFSDVASATTLDETPPVRPTSLSITDATNNSITLSWDAHPEINIEGYLIYRGASPTDTFTMLDTNLIMDTQYIDTGLQEVTSYYYKIKAIDDSLLESEFSDIAIGVTTLDPHAPEINNSQADFSIIEDNFDDSSISLYHWFKDINSDELEFRCEGQDHITVTIYQENGTVALEPDLNWNGQETLTFFASDGLFEISDDVTITVTEMNDPPEKPQIIAPDEGHVGDDKTSLKFQGQCSDPDVIYGDVLTYKWISNISGEIGTGNSLKERLLPMGSHLISFEVSDKDGLTSTASINITVLETPETDTDKDGIPNVWEREHGLDPFDPDDAGKDFDGDAVSNKDEYLAGTDPWEDETAKDEDTDITDGTTDTSDDTNGTIDGADTIDDPSIIEDDETPTKEKEDSSGRMIAIIVAAIIILATMGLLLFMKKKQSPPKVLSPVTLTPGVSPPPVASIPAPSPVVTPPLAPVPTPQLLPSGDKLTDEDVVAEKNLTQPEATEGQIQKDDDDLFGGL